MNRDVSRDGETEQTRTVFEVGVFDDVDHSSGEEMKSEFRTSEEKLVEKVKIDQGEEDEEGPIYAWKPSHDYKRGLLAYRLREEDEEDESEQVIGKGGEDSVVVVRHFDHDRKRKRREVAEKDACDFLMMSDDPNPNDEESGREWKRRLITRMEKSETATTVSSTREEDGSDDHNVVDDYLKPIDKSKSSDEKVKESNGNDQLSLASTLNTQYHNPRKYQNELFEQCREGNVIAVAPTGAGKTLIAVMLIQDALERDANRKVIFVVHKIPLVIQQRATFQNQLREPFCSRVGSFHSYKPFCEWKKAMEEYDVIVCTAQVLLNALEKPEANLQRVQLLIFDECHHAKANHPYRTLMKQFYFPLKRLHRSGVVPSIPRVLGLSASPAANTSTAETLLGILQLCYDLDCKIRTIEKHADELSQVIHIPDVQQYKVDMDEYSIELRSKLIIAINKMKRRIYLELSDSEGDRRASFEENNDLEPSQDSINELIQMTESRDQSEAMEEQAGEGICTIDPNQLSSLTTRERLSILGKLINLFHDSLIINDDRSSFHAWKLLSNQITNAKLAKNTFLVDALTEAGFTEDSFILDQCPIHCQKRHKLLQLLKDKRDEEGFKVLIFVKTRISAIELASLINEECGDFLKADVLLGHGGTSSIAGMTPARQKQVLEQFYNGGLNALIATSVAEEGLDIPTCKMVIRMDGVDSTLQLIQSRGRARSHNSEFYCIIHNQSRSIHHLQKYILQEKKMTRAISMLTHAERYTNDLYRHEKHIAEQDDLTMTVSHIWEILWFCCGKRQEDPFEEARIDKLESYPDKIATTLLHTIEKLLGVKADVNVEQDDNSDQYLGYVSIRIQNDQPKLTEPYQASNRQIIYADGLTKKAQEARNKAVKRAFELCKERDLLIYPSFSQKQESTSHDNDSSQQQKKKKKKVNFLQVSDSNLSELNLENAIGILQSYCTRKNDSSPKYNSISTDQRQYIYTCTISGNITVKTEAFNRKKDAKKSAALLMCQHIIRQEGSIEAPSSALQ